MSHQYQTVETSLCWPKPYLLITVIGGGGRVGVRGGVGGGGGLLPARVLDLHQLHWADAEADTRHSRHLAKPETRTLIHKQSKQKQNKKIYERS